jgi:hypothetical protein
VSRNFSFIDPALIEHIHLAHPRGAGPTIVAMAKRDYGDKEAVASSDE